MTDKDDNIDQYGEGYKAYNNEMKREAPAHLNDEDKNQWLTGYDDAETDALEEDDPDEDDDEDDDEEDD